MSLDLSRARADTPACEQVLHFNNAGASLQPECVLQAVREHIALEAQLGGYEAAERVADRIDHPHRALAQLLGCAADEIALVENATRAWDMAFHSLRLNPGDRILTGRAEYASNMLSLLQTAQRRGVRVELIPDDEFGQTSVSALRAMLDEKVRLIAITHVPSDNGLVNPAEAIGQIAREAGIAYLLDACQSVGQLPVDVAAIGCDMLSGTGRKFLRAPRGTGFLYVRRDWIERLDPPFIDMHSARRTAADQFEIRIDARRFESWEGNIAARIGLGVAADYANAWGMAAIAERASGLAGRLRQRLAAEPGIQVHDRGEYLCAIVTFSKADEPAPALRIRLRDQGIHTWVSLAEHAGVDYPTGRPAAVVRASLHYYNTDEEIEQFCRVLRAC